MDLQHHLRDQYGLEVETVGDIIGDAPLPPLAPLVVPTIPDYPVGWPGEGIFFGMPEDVYHAVPALSNGGIKKLAASPMIYWASCPWLNAGYEPPEEKEHNAVGHAYHCRILEGPEAYAARFAVAELNRDAFPDAIESTDEIKNAIERAGHKPATRVGIGEFVTDTKGVEKEQTRPAKKDDWTAQLLAIDPDAQIWSRIEAEFREQHAGKTFLSEKQHRQIELAAAMIECDPNIAPFFQGGHAEVSLFWVCPRTGVPKKARVDYLQFARLVDFKSFQNAQENSVDNAIRRAIANNRYFIQPAHYCEGADAVRKLVRARGASAVFSDQEPDSPEHAEFVTWAMRWAKQHEPDEWAWVFQQKGIAPVTRALRFPREGANIGVATDICMMMARRFRQFCEVYETSAWFDREPVGDLADEEIPNWSFDI